LSQSAYDLPASSSQSYAVDFGSPVQSVSATTPQALAAALNSNTDFSAGFKAR